MTIKVVIVDDEPHARKYIREMLRREPGVEILGEAGNGKDAARLIEERRPDLVFLDIQMPEMNGFEMLAKLETAELPVIIFTTAFEEYAIRAFEVHALDYLLKPFDQPRFAHALAHAREVLGEAGAKEQESSQIAELLDSIRAKRQFLGRFLIRKNGRIVFLKTDDVEWIEADDKYLHLYHGRSRHTIRQTLASIKSQLDPTRFAQVNRSVIVNVDFIKELQTMFGGEYEVLMSNGKSIRLSRNQKAELFEILGQPFA